MSIKGWIQPRFATWLTDPVRLERARQRAEARRQREGRPHTLIWYHRADDPWSHLLAQALTRLVQQYDVVVEGRTVPFPTPAAAPETEKLVDFSLRDARELCRYLELEPPGSGLPGEGTPPAEATQRAQRLLARAEQGEDYLGYALAVGEALWWGRTLPEPEDPPLEIDPDERLAANQARLHRDGHYLSGVIHYEGEWYWGVDRLEWLTERLSALGAGQGEVLARRSPAPPPEPADTLEYWLSFRSPYSYLSLERVFELGRRAGVTVAPRPVLPMVKRGLPVPRAKRLYILADAKREALRQGVPFGRICDPLPAVERALAIYPYAEAEGKAEAWLKAAMGGAWSRGLELAADAGLRRAVEEAGLDWGRAQRALADPGWEALAEANREALFDLGLWGVPSFKLGDYSTWGQDRIWLLEAKLGLTPAQ